ncbi:MAG: J domain-containing protein [Clostridiales bacterium]|nr:J domain-containing protein [Clostridiales bacterium]
MKNPYDILGVPSNATEDEIKKAYRNLSRKYHPDANVNNPNKEQAEERFKEVQQAYQTIMNGKVNGTSGYGSYGDYGSFGGFERNSGSRNASYGEDKENSYLQAAFTYVRSGDYQAALNVLSNIENRSGRWYYISAIANHGMGNQATALEHIQIAMRMEPGNMEYQQFYQIMENGGNWYASQGDFYGMPTMDGSSFCFKLCLANLACNFCCSGGRFCC